ncbi:hypothetical protein Sjap_020859 [Stephania japonica]|uniref:S-protein homolog n=1 Tax=Stephania japonica TaxID=461633 RepID=A0AAP0I0R8_9MAGN
MRNYTYLCIAIFLAFNLLRASLSVGMDVRVMNRLGHGKRVNVHCKSKDDDIGNRVLADGEELGWHFYVNFDFSTLFFCDVQWDTGTWYHFDAYNADSSFFDRCGTDCVWMITEKCLYVFNQRTYLWEPRPYEPTKM